VAFKLDACDLHDVLSRRATHPTIALSHCLCNIVVSTEILGLTRLILIGADFSRFVFRRVIKWFELDRQQYGASFSVQAD
jgi:hypothetical protein